MILPVLRFLRVVYKRVYGFLNENNLLYTLQYGFRKKHPTVDAVTQFVSDTILAFNNSDLTISVFFDLPKAFDTTDHKILLYKLEKSGIRGLPLEWFKNYLTNRKQFVTTNNVNSGTYSVTCGVPQGSVLGRLLFLVYIVVY